MLAKYFVCVRNKDIESSFYNLRKEPRSYHNWRTTKVESNNIFTITAQKMKFFIKDS